MVIGDFHFMGIAAAPHEAYPPPVIDADAMLPRAVARQLFQPIARRDAKELQIGRRVQLKQFAERDAVDIRRESARPFSFKELFCGPVRKIPYHGSQVNAWQY